MRPIFTITVTEPFLPIEEFCRRHAMPMGTARDMVKDGRLPVREKNGDKKRGKVLINMMALAVEALSSTSTQIPFNTRYE
ncbi:regulator [Xenorhabdus lircayensis]|uniref:Regulator n=1 Tax=Xenorhabdus lircayensis TaxID=2763499 RepID=A0ABS0U4S7_9GAMM|nr:regulator [Xenorhabdus lircayensis]MBI6548884.1 regulator [Xenorhabdus lircayensis]